MKEGTFALIVGGFAAWCIGLFAIGFFTRLAWEILKFGWGLL